MKRKKSFWRKNKSSTKKVSEEKNSTKKVSEEKIKVQQKNKF